MTETKSSELADQRLSTGVPGLDAVLHGGLLSRSVYIVQGGPGEGKTILANQLCYHRAALGERSLYVTLLAETHHRLLRHLHSMTFMNERATSDAVFYESAFDTLRSEGLEGVLRFLVRNNRTQKASVIVLDGLFALEESAETERSFREFINDIAVFADMNGCTVLLLTNSERGAGSPEFTMVDGWIELNSDVDEYRSFRYLCVHKFRGSGFVSGRHLSAITDAGLRVFPRLEAVTDTAVPVEAPAVRISSGIGGLDALIEGGLPHSSTTMLVGPTGVGKTSFGLGFICQSTLTEPGLVFGFYEDAKRLERRAETLGMNLSGLIESGAVEVLHFSPTEQILDSLAEQLLAAVRRTGARRLLVDGVDALRQAAVYPGRLGRFLSALTSLLRTEGVTSLFTIEMPEMIGGEQQLKLTSVSPIAENIFLLRYAEIESRLYRTVSIVKMRESGFSPFVHEFFLDKDGYGVGEAMSSILGSAPRRPQQGGVDA